MMQADLLQQLQARAREIEMTLRSERAERISAVSPDARLWLAVSPAWTYELATLVGFPASGDLPTTVAQLHELGLCEIAQAQGTTRFWMPSATRDGVLTDLAVRDAQLSARVGVVMGDIGRRVVDLGDEVDDTILPSLVRRWAALAQHAPDTTAIAAALEQAIDACLRSTDAEHGKPESALGWIDAARPLGQLLGDAVASMIRQQGRRIDLVYRRRDDQRHLEHFMPRADAMTAFTRLVSGPDDQWALHYLGAGGVGKTMLMRWISGQWAQEAGAATARIDFDYLNPEFPTRAPALLLAQLMQDLRLYANDSADRSFALFEARMMALHERARTAATLDAAQREEAVEAVIETFSGAVQLLGRQVVLLLDTCEELAKARIGGDGLPENVRATFDLLEGLHERIPSLRVAFCGRRPLASAGHGWSVPDVHYPVRPYLSLVEVRGFTGHEANTYLEQERIPALLVAPILDSSIDHTPPLGVIDGDASNDGGVRYMPFSLRLYARWIAEDPELDAETIRAGDTDAYIENRVYGRVRRTALRELVPVIALLARVDEPLLRAVSSASATEFAEAIGELHEQDWVHREADGVYAMAPHLQQRLLAYLERTGRTALSGTRRRAAAHLMRVTTEVPLDRLAVSHIESTVRLLGDDPRQAFEWWSRLEARFAEQGAMTWALEVLRRLLAEDGPLTGTQEHPLLVAVLATYASARMHAGELTQLNRLWRAVVGAASDDPRPNAAVRYGVRSAAGRIVAWHLRGEAIFPERITAFLHAVREAEALAFEDGPLTAAVLAAFEGLVEGAADARTPDRERWAPALLAWVEAVSAREHPPEIHAFAHALAARTMMLLPERSLDDLRAAWERALASGERCDGRGTQRWMDWHAPDDVRTRITLEYARRMSPALDPPRTVLARIGDQIRPAHTLDADRLNAMVLRMRSAESLPALGDMAPWLEASVDFAPHAPQCRSHAEVPSAYLLYWQYQAMVFGHVDEALTALREAAAALERSANALPALQVLELARLRIARRWRLADEERTRQAFQRPPTQLRIASGQHAAMAFDARDKLTRRVPWSEADWQALAVGERRAEWVHVLWRSIPIVDLEDATRALQWMRDAMAPLALPVHAPETARAAHGECLLDELELAALAPRYGLAAPPTQLARAGVSARRWIEAWALAHPLEPESALRLVLRVEALESMDPATPDALAQHRAVLGARIGVARAATVAHGEGELLTLRVPGAATTPLAQATAWFGTVGDAVGAWLAQMSLALDAIRHDDREAFRVHVQAALQRFDALDDRPSLTQTLPASATQTASFAVCPTRRELELMAKAPADAALDGIAPAGWRPWLIRTLLVRALQIDIEDDALSRSAVLQRWVVNHYGVRTSERPELLALPPDLAPWNVDVSAQSPSTASTFEETFITGAWRVPDAARRVARMMLRPSEYPAEGSGMVLAADATLEDDEVDEPLRLTWSERQSLAVQATQQDHVRERVSAWLAARGGVHRLELVVASPVAAAPWEALIARCLAPDDAHWREETPLILRRPRATRGTRGAANWPTVTTLFGHLPVGTLVRQFTAAWQPLTSREGTLSLLETGWGQFSAQERRTADAVVHLLGDPVETGRGDVALQLADSPHAGLTVVYRGQTSDAGAQRDGVLVRMRDVLERYRDAALIVLQAAPNDGERTFADRTTAAWLRRMAAELADAGVAAVLTLPPMRGNTARATIDHLAVAVADRSEQPVATVLESIAEGIDEAILEGYPQPSERRELLGDCCLYLGSVDAATK